MKKKPYIQQPAIVVVVLQNKLHLLSGSEEQTGPSADFMSDPTIG